jgi:hypothetical protein
MINKELIKISAVSDPHKNNILLDSDESIKGKKLSNVMMNLSVVFKETIFLKASKMIHSIFINFNKYNEDTIKDASIALKIIVSKYLLLFTQLHYCISLLIFGYNYAKDTPDAVKSQIIVMAHAIADNNQIKKLLYDNKFLSTLYKTILIVSTDSSDDSHAIDYIQLLYKLGNIERPMYYIPGESIEADKQRETFLKSGGLLLLFHLKAHCLNNTMQDYVVHTIIPQIDFKTLEKQMHMLKILPEQISIIQTVRVSPYINTLERSPTDDMNTKKHSTIVSRSIEAPLSIISHCLPIVNAINQEEVINQLKEFYKMKLMNCQHRRILRKKIMIDGCLPKKCTELDREHIEIIKKGEEQRNKRIEAIVLELELKAAIARNSKISTEKRKIRNYSQVGNEVEDNSIAITKSISPLKQVTTDRNEKNLGINKLYKKYKLNDYVLE